MDIEEELAELKAELNRINEDPKVKSYITSRQYRTLLKNQDPKICEICGKEYRITHLCETIWKFQGSELYKHYAAYEISMKSRSKTSTSYPKPIEPIKTPSSYIPSAKLKSQNKSTSSCGACVCVIVIVIILIIIF
jgi:hypothetical protein